MVFLTGARTRVGGPCRCSTLRWCLKKETSLIVVSMRSTQPYLSYILIEELAKRCLMQVPSTYHRQLARVSALRSATLHEGRFGSGCPHGGDMATGRYRRCAADG